MKKITINLKKDWLSELLILATFICYFTFNSVSISPKNNIYLYFVPICLLFLKSFFKVKKNGKMSKYILWYLLFFIYCVCSLIWSVNKSFSLRYLKIVFISLLFVSSLYIYTYDSKENLNRVINYYIIGLLIMIFRLVISESIFFDFKHVKLYGTSIGFYKNDIAMSLTMGIILLFYKYKSSRDKRYFILIFIFTYFMLLANSRKCIIFLVSVITMYYIFSTKFNISSIIKTIAILTLIGCLIVVIINKNPYIYERIINALSTFSEEKVDDVSAMERRFYRDTAKELFIRNPIFGTGINGFETYLYNINYSHIAYCHSNWLELLSTLGMIGFLIYYFQYYRIIKETFKKIPKDKKNERAIILSFMICLFFMEYIFVSYMYINIQVMLFIINSILEFNKNNNNKIIKE